MTQPPTIRADTPREAVEEVCKWLEAVSETAPSLAAMITAGRISFVLRSATIEPKEQADG
jgi:hypothetical protein